MLAYGGESLWRESCRAFLAASARDGTAIHVSAEAVQEFLFHRARRGDRVRAIGETTTMRRSVTAHPLDDTVLDEALRLMSVSSVRGRDAMHAATALLAGFTEIVSVDRDFDDVPGLRRMDPEDVEL